MFGTRPCLKSGRVHAPMDRVEIDAYDNGHRLIGPTLYIAYISKMSNMLGLIK